MNFLIVIAMIVVCLGAWMLLGRWQTKQNQALFAKLLAPEKFTAYRPNRRDQSMGTWDSAAILTTVLPGGKLVAK